MRVLFCVILLIHAMGVFSMQSTWSKNDSLIGVLEKAPQAERPALYYALADAWYEGDSLALAAVYYEKAAEEALKQKETDYKLVCEGYGNAGHCFSAMNRYREAIKRFEKGLQFAVEHHIRLEESIAYLNLGTMYFQLGDFEKAASLFNQSLTIDQELGDEEGVGVNYANLGKVYESWEKYDLALEFYLKALKISEENSDSARMSVRLSSAAMAYRGLRDYEKALDYLHRALEIDRRLQAEHRVGIRLSNLGLIGIDKGQYAEAEQYLLPALDIFKKYNNLRSMAITTNQLGNVRFRQGDAAAAISLYEESLGYARQIELPATIMKNHQDLAEAHETGNNFHQALINHKLYSQVKDSLFSESSRRTMQEIEAKYETAKSQAEIALLTQEKETQSLKLQRSRWQTLFILIFSVMLIVMVLILHSRYRIKQQANRQLQLLNATKDKFFTIIAHDLKNPLSSFRNITLGIKNALPQLSREELSYYINEINTSSEHLHALLTNLLQWSRSQTGMIRPCFRELDADDLIGKATQSVETDIHQKNIRITKSSIPGMKLFSDENVILTVLRNLLSNAVKFSDSGQEIKILVTKDGKGKVTFGVRDFGVGMNREDLAKLFRIDADTRTIGSSAHKGTGLGLILCRELLESIGGSIWADSDPGQGSIFSFSLPCKS